MIRTIWAVLILFTMSCAGIGTLSSRKHCPVEPMAVENLPHGRLLRAQVRMNAKEHEVSFEVIAQSKEGVLTLVGIAPYGMRLFEIQQRGLEFHQTSSTSRQMQWLAIFSADALYRAYWLQPPGSNEVWVWDGERVTESSHGQQRLFRQKDASSGSSPVTIDYHDQSNSKGLPGASIENPWCGYRAVIVPLDS